MSTQQQRKKQDISNRRVQRRIDREKQQRQQRIKRAALAVAGLAGLALVVWIGYGLVQDQDQNQNQNQDGTPPALVAGIQSFELDASHTNEPVEYEQTPPAGGPHSPVWQNCGVYDDTITNENAVHSLEHGAVWITYRPDLPSDQVDALARRAEGTTFIIISPHSNLPTPIVMSAWNRQLQVSDVNDPAIDAFIQEFRLGQQAPEPGAPCTGGTSETS